uniref:Uncharacterized protein n=1 Tax=Siphoviridae sp. ctTwu10 TaxID=2825525 RepID=A0A8S5P888_9CAUD|nr:MAG TPA: hypothetical protein [Siphoviridae sp. ctTwu10]
MIERQRPPDPGRGGLPGRGLSTTHPSVFRNDKKDPSEKFPKNKKGYNPRL